MYSRETTNSELEKGYVFGLATIFGGMSDNMYLVEKDALNACDAANKEYIDDLPPEEAGDPEAYHVVKILLTYEIKSMLEEYGMFDKVDKEGLLVRPNEMTEELD